jgi:hypothetical protein
MQAQFDCFSMALARSSPCDVLVRSMGLAGFTQLLPGASAAQQQARRALTVDQFVAFASEVQARLDEFTLQRVRGEFVDDAKLSQMERAVV